MDAVPTTAGPNRVSLQSESIAYLQKRAASGQKKYYWELGVEKSREVYNAMIQQFRGPCPFSGKITNRKITNGMPIRVYQPKTSRPDPAIMMWFHGGGHVLGSIEGHDALCRTLADFCDVIIVSVEYRLAPEHKFPAGLEDCDNATKWVIQNKEEVGGSERSLVGVGGDSAGGQLAALSAHYVDQVAFQLLVYGIMDERMTFPSYTEFEDGPQLTLKTLNWYQNHRLPDMKESLTNPRFSPLQQPKLDQLPPALFIVAECDPLRDDSLEYQKALSKAGVYTELYVIKGTLHGFFAAPGHYKDCCKEAYGYVKNFIDSKIYNK